jgi:hypothetical protein
VDALPVSSNTLDALWEPNSEQERDNMAERVQRANSKGAIDRAGEMLVPWWRGAPKPEPSQFSAAFDAVENWRTCHALPLLTLRMNLTGRSRRVDSTAIIAQRLKRFSSAMNKLAREPKMKLSQMQDLGGCRAIVSDVSAVRRLFDLYAGEQATLLQSEGGLVCDNHLDTPRESGYRGIHVIARYEAQIKENEPWNGQRIEVQLRSQLQHAFATAVETVTTFTGEPLKFGAGPQDWRRFFSLMGTALALREGTPPVPNTPTTMKELVTELRANAKELRVGQRLRGWAEALKVTRKLPKGLHRPKWLLLVLDAERSLVRIRGFADSEKARQALAEIEQSADARKLDAVRVWVGDVRNLRRAYPNYYADTAKFLKALDEALAQG